MIHLDLYLINTILIRLGTKVFMRVKKGISNIIITDGEIFRDKGCRVVI